MRRTGPFPTFLIIGAQKSATRWLRVNLGEHPDAFTVPGEVEFFNLHFRRGVRWYRSWFDDWKGERAVGEATPGYMMQGDNPGVVAARIDGMLPDVRLIALLRNPVDRAYSAFVHHMARDRIPPDADLLDYVERVDPERDELGIINGGWYARSLAPYAERFGDRLLILLHDDVSADPVAVYRSAAAHVGVSPDVLPPEIDAVRFSNQPPGGSPYAAGEGGRRPLTADERARLYEFYRRDIARLERMFGLGFQRWHPAAVAVAVS
jgi:hypothetical protein